MGFPLVLAFAQVQNKLQNIMGKQLAHVSNQQQIFKKDKMNNSSGVVSPRRLFFFGYVVFLNTKCHSD